VLGILRTNVIYVNCQRCGRSMYKYNTCNYCKRQIDVNCTKSSRRVSKVIRIVICKDDWSKLPARKAFKSMTKET